MSPEDEAAEAYAHENTFDNEYSQVRNAFLAGIEWARRNSETVTPVTDSTVKGE